MSKLLQGIFYQRGRRFAHRWGIYADFLFSYKEMFSVYQ